MRELHLRTFDQLAVNHHVHVVCRLTSHGLHHGGVGVADVVHRHARHEVVIAFAFGGVEEYALGARHLDHHRRRRGLAHMRQKPFSQYLAHKLSCSVSYAVRRRRQDCASLGELQSAAWGGGELPISLCDIDILTPFRIRVRGSVVRRAPTPPSSGTAARAAPPRSVSNRRRRGACAATAYISIWPPRPTR